LAKDFSAAETQLSTLKLKEKQNHVSKFNSTFNVVRAGEAALQLCHGKFADKVQNWK